MAATPPDLFDLPVRPELAREFLADPRHHLVAAMVDGVIVGFASGVHYVHPDKAPELFVNEVGVLEAHQGRGIGRRVVRALLEHGAALGCREAWVLTDEENTAARATYRTAGGTEVAARPVMFSFALGDQGA